MADLLIPAAEIQPPAIVTADSGLPAPTAIPPRLSDAEVEEIQANVESSDADNTKRAYATAWDRFTRFCAARGATALPAHPTTLAAYLSLATKQDGTLYTTGSLNLHLSAIRRAHRERGLAAPTEHPLVYRTWKGVRRRRGTQQQGAAPLTADLLAKVATACDARDRAILLVGFAGAFRRSELAALRLCDVGFVPQGIRLRVVRRKTGDDEAYIDLATGSPAAEALTAWIDKLVKLGEPMSMGDGTGSSLFRVSGATVRNVVMRGVEAAGMDPGLFSAHSLRSGYATSAAEGGQGVMEIRDAGGWKSIVTVDRYVRHRRAFGPNAPRSRVQAALAEEIAKAQAPRTPTCAK